MVSSLCISEKKQKEKKEKKGVQGRPEESALSELDLLMAMMALLSYAISTPKEKILVGLICIFYRYCRSSVIPRGSFLFIPINLFPDYGADLCFNNK